MEDKYHGCFLTLEKVQGIVAVPSTRNISDFAGIRTEETRKRRCTPNREQSIEQQKLQQVAASTC